MRWGSIFVLLLTTCDRSGSFPCAESESSAMKLDDGGTSLAHGDWWNFPLRLDIQGTAGSEMIQRICTGIRVSSTGILTAKHCFRNFQSVEGRLVIQSLEGSTARCVAHGGFTLEDLVLHPSRDAALVRVKDPHPGNTAVVSTRLPEPQAVFVMAGFGLDERGVSGELRAILASVVSADANYIVAQGVGGGACVGDSGTPLYLPDQGLAVGLLSRGSASCVGRDEFVPTASIQDWLSEADPKIRWQ